MRYLFFLIAPLLFILFSSSAQPIFDINEKLGRGINYGNMFEAPTETEWGNPWQPEYPGIIAGLGFDHVRIPIRWEPEARSSATAPYTIDPTFLARIKEVVDATLEQDLLAIVNMHHHEALYEDPDANKARFLAQWEKISDFFKDYSDDLVFEIMNEPHGNLTPAKWNEFYQDALDVIRVENPTRAVLIGTAEYGGLGGLPQLEIADDDYIILTVHYYNPFQFTHQGAEWVEGADAWSNVEWQDSDLEREVIENEFAYLLELSEEENIPVHVGEFGAYSTADLVSREKWTTFLGRYFETLGWSWAYWEFSAGFGIYDPDTETYIDELVDGLLHNEMPDPATYERTNIYQSDFSTDMDGWTLTANNGANAQLTRESNSLKVSISALGAENWDIQLVKNNFTLEAGKKYSFSFDGSAVDSRSVNFYMGMNGDPWTQYGSIGITLTSTKETYSGVFDMTSTDASARLVFDLGSSIENITISDVKVQELELKFPDENPVDSELSVESAELTTLYPNPTQDILNINNSSGFNNIAIFNVHGQVIFTSRLKQGENAIDIQNVQKGICLVILSNQEKRQVFKIINE